MMEDLKEVDSDKKKDAYLELKGLNHEILFTIQK